MEHFKLTPIERQILCNQYIILDKLYPDDGYHENVEILMGGYIYHYPSLINVTTEEIDPSVCEETIKILDMFRIINNSIHNLSSNEKDSLDIQKIRFSGFDGNKDPHYLYAKFMIRTQNKWDEYKNAALDSHDYRSLEKYRKLLAIAKNKNHLNLDDLKKMIDAV